MTPLLLLVATAQAADFTLDITNNSTFDWTEGVAAVMDEASNPNSLMPIGDTPTSGDLYDTFRYIDSSCDRGQEDDGDADKLIRRWGPLTEDVNAWVVPALAPGDTTTVHITAYPGEVLSFVARVDPSGDDMVMMHAIGDPLDTTIDLFNHVDLPLFNVRFDIKGYDPNTTNPDDGDASSCSPDCPATGNNCYVALGNGNTGAEAGGSQTPPDEPDFGLFPGWSLSPTGWYANGVGSPSVIRRAIHDDYLMVFESRLTDTDAVCPAGIWGIGLATSTNGYDWTVEPSPIVTPAEGTYYRCVAAHPNIIIDDDGSDVHLYFKAEQGTDACDTSTPTWGCNRYTGVGYLKFNGTTGAIITEAAEPVVSQDKAFGFPSVVKVDGTYNMMLATYPSFYLATALAPEGPWTTQVNPVMEPGVIAWASTEVYNPSLVCEGDTAPLPPYEFSNFFGGRTTDGMWGPITDGGVGEAISTNGTNWFLGTTPFTFSDDTSWRHWEAVRAGSAYLLYFSEKDAQGRNNIGLAATGDEWSDADVATDICPQPAWW